MSTLPCRLIDIKRGRGGVRRALIPTRPVTQDSKTDFDRESVFSYEKGVIDKIRRLLHRLDMMTTLGQYSAYNN